jgi:hypothetical protein
VGVAADEARLRDFDEADELILGLSLLYRDDELCCIAGGVAPCGNEGRLLLQLSVMESDRRFFIAKAFAKDDIGDGEVEDGGDAIASRSAFAALPRG